MLSIDGGFTQVRSYSNEYHNHHPSLFSILRTYHTLDLGNCMADFDTYYTTSSTNKVTLWIIVILIQERIHDEVFYLK